MEKEIKKLEGIEEEKVAAGAGKKCNCYRCNKSLGGWFGDKSCYLYGKYYCDSCYNIVSEAEKLGHAPYNNSLNEKVVVLEDNLKKLEEKLNKLKG